MAVMYGGDVAIYVNTAATGCTPSYTKAAYQRGMTITNTADSIDTSNKEDGAWKTSIVGRLTASVSFDGLIPSTTSTAWTALLSAFTGRTSVLVRTYEDSTPKKSGVAYITELSENYGDNAAGTYSAKLDISGGFSDVAA